METSPAGITMVNRKGQVTFANRQAEKVLGLTKDKISQRTYNDPDWHITDYEGNPFPEDKLSFSPSDEYRSTGLSCSPCY
jgi:two-component system CheB/CheR fusion protein